MALESWLALGGLILAGSISPGPNNALALRAGLQRDQAAALAVIAGVQIGCLILFALSWAGLAALLQANPIFAPLLTIVGAGYLAWLGARLMRGTPEAPQGARRELGAWSIAWLQFVNPKAWILVITVAAATAEQLGRFGLALLLFVSISALSLWLWSAAGAQLARWLSSPHQRLWFDRAMGLLLVLSGLTLIISDIEGITGHGIR